MSKAIRVTVPATSANLGPGFDCLGLALGLYNVVEISTVPSGMNVKITGEGAGSLPTDSTNMIVQAAEAVFAKVGERLPGLHIWCENGIPQGSGLGSSAAALVCGVMGANVLLGNRLSHDDLLVLLTELEGHPDNVCAAMAGKLNASSYADNHLVTRRISSIDDLQVVVVLPDVAVSTKEQRAALPTMVPLADAAATIGRAILVARALGYGDLNLLSEVMHDRLHEPTRCKAIPGYEQVIEAARGAGAAAVAISGAGPSLIAFAEGDHEGIGAAMAQAFREVGGIEARHWVLPMDTWGTQYEILSG